MSLKSKVVACIAMSAMALSSMPAASAAGIGSVAGMKGVSAETSIVEVKGRGARNVGLGILGAAAAIAIISGAAKADQRERGYRGGGDSCRHYMRKCDQGQAWACRKWDNRCHDY